MRWLGAGLAAAALAAFGVWVLFVSSWLGVREVHVTGAGHLSAAELVRAAAIDLGTPMARLDTEAAERRLEQVPGVHQATVERSWPHAVRIEVVESAPVAVVLHGGTYSAMDDAGELFREWDRPPQRLPLVRADSLGSEGRSAALAEVAEVVSSLDPQIARRVEHVELSSIDSIVLVLHDGDEVLWGSAESSPRKAAVLSALLDIEASVYDVSVPEQPTTRS